jgi:DNA processing protein
MTTDIVRALVGRSLAIVSGGAYGIDIEAHRVCLEEGGRAICVLGSGLRALYPKAHERYFERMLSSGGVLVSEYPPHELPRPWTFPERNRLIAALSDFVVLAQAHVKSGSLSTARTALDLGKEVFVLRPVPEDPAFDGSRVLIDSGATILTEPAQLN